MGKILKISNFKKAIHYLKKNGLRQAYYAVKERIGEEKADDYTYEAPLEEALEKQRRESGNFSCKFSILVPAYETIIKWKKFTPFPAFFRARSSFASLSYSSKICGISASCNA